MEAALTAHITVLEARDLVNRDSGSLSDPFCVVSVDGKKLFTTKVIKDNLNPVWLEAVPETRVNSSSVISFELWDEDIIRNDFLGGFSITVKEIQHSGCFLEDFFLLENTKEKSKKDRNFGRLHLRFILTTPTARLSSPLEKLEEKTSCNVVVIGSGYGGAIAACRAAEFYKKVGAVVLLEKGREYQPGEFPNTLSGCTEQLQCDVHGAPDVLHNPIGLYHYIVDEDVSILKGCGLGGTSLINANVMEPAVKAVWNDPVWPKELRGNISEMSKYSEKARVEMIQAQPIPEDRYSELQKAARLKDTVDFLKKKYTDIEDLHIRKPNIAVNYTVEGVNKFGVYQRKCVHCGDCTSGCNYAAKNTTAMNYLPHAHTNGAEIFTQTECLGIEKSLSGPKWTVNYKIHYDHKPDKVGSIKADFVFLGAGSIGSTKILQKSTNVLSFSDQLGKRFSTNGDMLSFAFNGPEPAYNVGLGPKPPTPANNPPGPCITSIIDYRGTKNFEEGFVIEDGTPPGAMQENYRSLLAMSALDSTENYLRKTLSEKGKKEKDETNPSVSTKALKNSFSYLIMSHDNAAGEIKLNDKGHVRVSWKKSGGEGHFSQISQILRSATENAKYEYFDNPMWSGWGASERAGVPEEKLLITVHPLGGCPMGDTRKTGVVNHCGQVFCGSTENDTDVYEGLYVLDGAIVPRSLGVNPAITISGLAERGMEIWRKQQQALTNSSATSTITIPVAKKDIGIYFRETMLGHLNFDVKTLKPKVSQLKHEQRRALEESLKNNTYDKNSSSSSNTGQVRKFSFTAKVTIENLPKFLYSDPKREGRLAGSVEIEVFKDGSSSLVRVPFCDDEPTLFQLFVDDEKNPRRAKFMNYGFAFIDPQTKQKLFFFGTKYIRDEGRIDFWYDSTTLFCSVKSTSYNQAQMLNQDDENRLAHGVVRVTVPGFSKQLTTMTVTGASDPIQNIKWTAVFGQFFAGELYNVYAGFVSKISPWNYSSTVVPRKKRQLEYQLPNTNIVHPLPPPEMHTVVIPEDGAHLVFRRYKGGSKGPVICTHGLGVNSTAYALDTVKQNFVEFLFGHGYDIWLLESRMSTFLPELSEHKQFDCDLVARDHTAFVDKVLEVTGAKTVQIVAHCFGSISFFMALSSGYLHNPKTGKSKIRSVVASQVGMHAVPGSKYMDIMSKMHAPTVMKFFGLDGFSAHPDYNKFSDRLANVLIDSEGFIKCPQGNDTCSRISFMYSPLYNHDNMNELTHQTLHETFGFANVTFFRHAAQIVRHGMESYDRKVVYHKEEDVTKYCKMPVHFIHGENNQTFNPISTEKSVELLKKCNPELASEYTRTVLKSYFHIDPWMGKNIHKDVFPDVLVHLEKYATEQY